MSVSIGIMRKYLFILIFSFSFYMVFSQDKIVTFSNDTIKCKIEKIKKNYIRYIVNSNSVYVHTDTVLSYKMNGSDFVVIPHKFEAPWSDSVKYIASVSAGIGVGHCGTGVRAIIGWKGLSGLSLSAGTDGKNFLWQAGITGRVMNAYASISYGTMDYYKFYNSHIPDEEKNIRGIAFEMGYLFYFGQDKKFFVSAALDATRYFYTQQYTYDPKEQDVWEIGFGFDAGLGVRF